MSEMLKKIISVLLAENVEFGVSKMDNRYIVYSPILCGATSIWFVEDNYMMDAPRFYLYRNNYKKGFIFSRYQDYITAITDIVINYNKT